jgi:energy-coupling factor transporter ATP-binding protein EcfA2
MADHPITHATVASFGPFQALDLDFSPGLNVIVGENGAGKSQLLKLLYTTTAVLSAGDGDRGPTKGHLNSAIARKLLGVFRPWSLGRLTNRRQGRVRCEASIDYRGLGSLAFGFASNSSSEVKVDLLPSRFLDETPAFIPTRELLSIYRGLAALYDERAVDFDETWRDTALLLARPVRRGVKEATVQRVLRPITEALGGGRIYENNSGEFVLSQPGLGNLEMHLVAEGFRKLGMVAQLVASGVLLEGGYLFWDEPEANLNPKTLRQVAETIVALAQSGVQVFLATHSVFLLRELEMHTLDAVNVPISFIGLHRDDTGSVTSTAGPAVSDIGDITALDAELSQAGRYLERSWE